MSRERAKRAGMRVRQSQHLIFNPYIAATAMCLASLLFAYLARPLIGAGPPFTFMVAVAISAWYGGTRVGVYASVLTFFMIYFGIMVPGIFPIQNLAFLAFFEVFCL